MFNINFMFSVHSAFISDFMNKIGPRPELIQNSFLFAGKKIIHPTSDLLTLRLVSARSYWNLHLEGRKKCIFYSFTAECWLCCLYLNERALFSTSNSSNIIATEPNFHPWSVSLSQSLFVILKKGDLDMDILTMLVYEWKEKET